MEWINVAKLRKLPTEDIYCLLLPQIEELYTKYDYIPLAKEYYDEVILDSLEEILNDTQGRSVSIEALIQKIDIYLQNYLKSLGLLKEEDISIVHKEVGTIRNMTTEPILSQEKEVEIISCAKQGDKEAMEELIRRNHGLLNKMAFRMQEEGSGLIIEYADLYQEAVLALYRAVEKYDIEKCVPFSTYLTKVIFRNLIDYIETCEQMNKRCYPERKLFKETYEYFEVAFKKPSLQAVADIVGISFEKANYYYNTLFPLSLDSILDEEGTTLKDSIEDENAISLEKHAINIELAEKIKKVLLRLTPDQQKIIALRYGFVDGKEHKQTEIAQAFGVKKQSISQSEIIALRKLRENEYLRELL